MTTASLTQSVAQLEAAVRAQRLWYHDIALRDGVRTRFPDDYALNPVLARVDRSCTRIEERLDARLPGGLNGMSVLDAGCADGRFIVWAARRGADRVVGIERNRYNHHHAVFVTRTLGLDHVELRCGSIERNLGVESFDAVLCLGLVYHLIDPLGSLHALRRRCRTHLFLSAAIDLADDGSPMCRFDRYASGAHGLWSFNLSMIRQLLATAGFAITHEDIIGAERASRHVFLHAVPANFAEHHIFEETIDQEWPVNIARRRERVRAVWSTLAAHARKPIVIFGAGTHTPWLLDQIVEHGAASLPIEAILDDRAAPGQRIAHLPVIRPTDLDPAQIGTVVVSSWHQSRALRARARAVFGSGVSIASFDD